MNEAFTDELDFAVAAYVDEGEWQVAEMIAEHVVDIGSLTSQLRRFAGEGSVVGLVAVDEDFFVIARVTAHGARVMLSDVTAASEWEFAASVCEYLGIPQPEDDEEYAEPAGDLELLKDLGVDATALAELLDDEEAYPDEQLSEVARLLGFGELFDDTVGLASA
ncbi:tRNA adenosine deaminase-associated protein [Nocardioides montaniterrae]